MYLPIMGAFGFSVHAGIAFCQAPRKLLYGKSIGHLGKSHPKELAQVYTAFGFDEGNCNHCRAQQFWDNEINYIGIDKIYTKAVRHELRKRYDDALNYKSLCTGDWVYPSDRTNVAIHIRRGDVTRLGGNADRYTSLQAFSNTMAQIRMTSPDALFHIYSEGAVEDFALLKGADVRMHVVPVSADASGLANPILCTFHGFVTADKLVMSKSSFSYAAGIISTGTVYWQTKSLGNKLKDWVTMSDITGQLHAPTPKYQFHCMRPWPVEHGAMCETAVCDGINPRKHWNHKEPRKSCCLHSSSCYDGNLRTCKGGCAPLAWCANGDCVNPAGGPD
jgi:hypothetical protein